MNINSVTIVGRLVRDPELKALPLGISVCSFSIATSQVSNKDGQKTTKVEYHNVIAFGKQADLCATFLKKGRIAGIQGRLQTRNWEKDGVKHYRTEVVADRVHFGPGEKEREPEQEKVTVTAPEYPDDDINPEDIPF